LLHEKTGIRLLETLAAADATLLVTVGDEIVFARREQGIAPLLDAVKTLPQSTLQDASVADLIVGKAGALLMVHAGVSFVAAQTASDAATATLRAHRIPFYVRHVVEMIHGRRPGQSCPFEQAVRDVDDPGKAFVILSETARRLARAKHGGRTHT
jgi:hypothetical protein